MHCIYVVCGNSKLTKLAKHSTDLEKPTQEWLHGVLLKYKTEFTHLSSLEFGLWGMLLWDVVSTQFPPCFDFLLFKIHKKNSLFPFISGYFKSYSFSLTPHKQPLCFALLGCKWQPEEDSKKRVSGSDRDINQCLKIKTQLSQIHLMFLLLNLMRGSVWGILTFRSSGGLY